MGCDIHPILERKYKDPKTGEERWVGINAFPYVHADVWKNGELVYKNHLSGWRAKQRNYRLFAALAGVRGEGPEPRGVPEDASDLTKMLFADREGDGHSHSWCSAHEWIQAALASEQDQANLHLADNPEDPRLKQPYDHYVGLDIDWYDDAEKEPWQGKLASEYRMVFCFDN